MYYYDKLSGPTLITYMYFIQAYTYMYLANNIHKIKLGWTNIIN